MDKKKGKSSRPADANVERMLEDMLEKFKSQMDKGRPSLKVEKTPDGVDIMGSLNEEEVNSLSTKLLKEKLDTINDKRVWLLSERISASLVDLGKSERIEPEEMLLALHLSATTLTEAVREMYHAMAMAKKLVEMKAEGIGYDPNIPDEVLEKVIENGIIHGS